MKSLLIAVILALGITITEAQEEGAKIAARAGPQAVDLTKIERKILKEPAYQTKKQEYCLLVFGPEAKLRVWLVLDGGTLYVDHNGNGDLTDPGERFPVGSDAGDIDDPFGKTRHLRLVVFGTAKQRDTDKNRGKIRILKIAGKYRQDCSPKYGSRPSEAPIIHFNGPVTLELDEPHERISKFGIGPAGILRRGREAYVPGHLGTPGLGEGSFAYYWAREIVPDGLTVEFEFPAAAKNLVSVRTKGRLKPDDIMMEINFPVPAQAKLGTVDIKASLPDKKGFSGVPFTIPKVEIRE